MSMNALESEIQPDWSAARIATAAVNRRAALTVVAWALRSGQQMDALTEVLDALGIEKDDLRAADRVIVLP
jgi:hypothetical protein